MQIPDPKAFLTALYHIAVRAADPDAVLSRHLPDPPKGRTIIIGAGKASAQMARAFEAHWPTAVEGTVVTRYGHGVPCQSVEVLEASHPVPDAAGLAATARLKERLSGLGPDDLVVALISGGGSALLPAPPAGFELQDEIDLNTALLASGAPISVMNAIRRQFSTVKGGRLAALAHPARVVSLVLSDVPGDNAADVASGPTIPSTGTGADALALADLWRIDLSEKIRAHLATAQSPQPNDANFARHQVRLIASANQSLEAAATYARSQGITAVILSDQIEGEAREAGAFHAALATHIQRSNQPFAKPVLLLSGGETSVTLRHKGRGGRNTEFLLAFAGRIAGAAGIYAMAADTDGIDGLSESAGAFASATTVMRLLQKGLRWDQLLSQNDSWTAFDALDDLLTTGPTGTNVNDFRAVLVI